MDARDLPMCGISFVSSTRLYDVDIVYEMNYSILKHVVCKVSARESRLDRNLLGRGSLTLYPLYPFFRWIQQNRHQIREAGS